MRRQIIDWEKIFANYIIWLKTGTHNVQRTLKIQQKKNEQPDYKMGKRSEQTPLQKKTANKHVKRCSISYITNELQIKTMKYHYTHIRKESEAPVLVRMWSNRDSHSLPVGMHNSPATLKHSLTILVLTKLKILLP